MAREHLYSVAFISQKLVDEYRGDRNYGDLFHVIKYDKLLRVEEDHYEVVCSSIGDWCNCPAGRRNVPRSDWKKKPSQRKARSGNCRHLDMVYLFKGEGAVGSYRLYDYDKGAWVDG